MLSTAAFFMKAVFFARYVVNSTGTIIPAHRYILSCKSEPNAGVTETFSFMLSITLFNLAWLNFRHQVRETYSAIALLSTFSRFLTRQICSITPIYLAFTAYKNSLSNSTTMT
ncbi:hypothetical protein [Kluyvera sichuanensis]|uniref:hypothetical protein n=1 Tax=Kluyvera sichuanensis TaxID=2725494 RepID=UPI0039F58E21